MSLGLILDVLRMAGLRSRLFVIDDRLRLSTRRPGRTMQYLVANRIAAIAGALTTIESDDLRRAIEGVTFREGLVQDLIDWHGRRAIACLARSGVRTVQVKGPLAAALYPDPRMRPFTDIDLFVDRTSVETAAAALATLGFVRVLPDPTEDLRRHAEMHLRDPESGALIDLHWDLVSSRALARGLHFDLGRVEGELRRCAARAPQAWEFSPELLFVYLASHHVLHHRLSGIVWLLDILLLLEREREFDWARANRLAELLGLERHVYFYTWALRRLGLGPPVPEARREMRPAVLRYHVAMRICPPETIFFPETRWLDLRRRVFREAFKLPPAAAGRDEPRDAEGALR